MCASLSAINRWVSLTMEDHYQLPTADDDEDEDTAIATTTISSNIFSLPEEVILKIIALLDPFDVWSLARTCKFFAQLTDNELLWRHQWAKLSAKTPFRFPPSHNLQVWGSKFFIFFTCCLLCDLHNFDIPAIYLWKCFYMYKLYAVFMSKLQFLCVPFVRSTVCNVYGLYVRSTVCMRPCFLSAGAGAPVSRLLPTVVRLIGLRPRVATISKVSRLWRIHLSSGKGLSRMSLSCSVGVHVNFSIFVCDCSCHLDLKQQLVIMLHLSRTATGTICFVLQE